MGINSNGHDNDNYSNKISRNVSNMHNTSKTTEMLKIIIMSSAVKCLIFEILHENRSSDIKYRLCM